MYGAVSDLRSATLCVRSLWTCFSKRVVRGNHCERERSLSGKRRDGVPPTRKTGARFRNPRGYEDRMVWAGGKGVVERNKTYTLTKEEINSPKRRPYPQKVRFRAISPNEIEVFPTYPASSRNHRRGRFIDQAGFLSLGGQLNFPKQRAVLPRSQRRDSG